MLYQRIQLPSTNIGQPGPLPPYLVGYADASLANLSAALSPDVCAALGFTGQGFIPQPAPAVPGMVSRMQAQLALQASGKLDAVNAVVAAADDRTKIYWATAADFHRNHPLVISLGAAVGLSPAAIDALFITAAGIS